MKLSYSTIVFLLKEHHLYLSTTQDQEHHPSKNLENTFNTITTKLSEVQAQSIFIAYKGIHYDSHQNIPKALEQGASLVIFEEALHAPILQNKGIQVTSARQAWSILCSFIHGHPEKKLSFIGITGTNGKTSTAWFISKILDKLYQEKVLLIGTLGAFLLGSKIETFHTTPDPDQLFSLLDRAVQAGVTSVVMEVSSQSILHKRLGPIKFKTCIFTSFSRDHLDLHHTMENYWDTKVKLFTDYMLEGGCAIICKDVLKIKAFPLLKKTHMITYEGLSLVDLEKTKNEDPSLIRFAQETDHCGLKSALVLKNSSHRWQGAVKFFDLITCSNFVAALLAIYAMKDSIPNPEEWHKISSPPGRMEAYYKEGISPLIIVDYAHTPDGLEKILLELKKITTCDIWTVFGCGGDRDIGRRSLMGQVAEKYSSYVVVTSDNPRSEDPQKIISDIIQDLKSHKKIIIKPDRKEAIEYSIKQAQPKDTVLIAGKGAELFQIIGKEKIPFDDREIVKKILEQI